MEKTDSRDRIIAVAIAEFADKGKAGARMERIAHEAGVNKAMLYYYFSSKDTLYYEALKAVFGIIMDKQRYLARTSGTIRSRIHEIVNHIIETGQAHPEYIRLIMHEILSSEQNLATIAKELSPDQAVPYTTGIATMLIEGQEQGLIRSGDILQIAISIIALCFFHTLWFPLIKAMWHAADLDEAAFVECRKAYIMDLLENGLISERDGVNESESNR
ncbi:TetR/AcrR family transcriptional regulator [bacterium]|nr:TetR/AcrR family transcriptional regulator [bacterium]